MEYWWYGIPLMVPSGPHGVDTRFFSAWRSQLQEDVRRIFRPLVAFMKDLYIFSVPIYESNQTQKSVQIQRWKE